MIIRKVAVGNGEEAFIEDTFSEGLNILLSDDNNKGKTIIIQSMLYALGNKPIFPNSFNYKDLVYYLEFEHNGEIYVMVRSGDEYVLKYSDKIRIFEGMSELKRFWNSNIFQLPIIQFQGENRIVDMELFVQLFFVGQDGKDTSTIFNSGFYHKIDFKNMLLSYSGDFSSEITPTEIKKIKDKIKELGYESVSYALSTMMPNDNLEKLSVLVNEYNIPLKVHFSLHTPIDSERKELIPSTRVNVSDALKLLSNYKNQVMKNEKIMDNYIMFHRNNIPVEIHYTLIKGVNDGNKELKCLINLLKEYNIPIKFIKFNETNTLKKSDNEEIWIKSLKEELPNLNIKSYSPPGRCVGSSCGEFTKHYYHYEIETKEELEKFLKWKKEYEI